mmetsp:Transcript_13940/g.27864  ORF Transcript_13940/g.27864 Transcript_13940/m.27864 type:complete len:103 (+) Transcript_13940:3109-3417(+)
MVQSSLFSVLLISSSKTCANVASLSLFPSFRLFKRLPLDQVVGNERKKLRWRQKTTKRLSEEREWRNGKRETDKRKDKAKKEGMKKTPPVFTPPSLMHVFAV